MNMIEIIIYMKMNQNNDSEVSGENKQKDEKYLKHEKLIHRRYFYKNKEYKFKPAKKSLQNSVKF